MLTGTLVLSLVGLICTGLLLLATRRFHPNDQEVVTLILKELPQTQCAQCGYPGCRPYAEAITNEDAPINRCPPGGDNTIRALANLLGRPALPLDASGGDGVAKIAKIRESECIGCTLCLPACPVDAIIGAPQMLHAIIGEACTGCELCIAPCPVDCIDMLPLDEPEVTPPTAVLPCIHCGDCIPVCPRQLTPVQLYQQDQSLDVLVSLRLTDCIECGLCDRVCPSNIPLTDTFALAKQRLADRQAEALVAEQTEQRVNQHDARLLHAQSVTSKPDSSNDLLARLKGEL